MPIEGLFTHPYTIRNPYTNEHRFVHAYMPSHILHLNQPFDKYTIAYSVQFVCVCVYLTERVFHTTDPFFTLTQKHFSSVNY